MENDIIVSENDISEKDISDKNISDKVVSKQIDGEAFLLNLESGEYFGLNRAGSLIWNSLVAGKKTDQIAQLVAEEFQVSEDEALSDIQALIKDCKNAKLISEA